MNEYRCRWEQGAVQAHLHLVVVGDDQFEADLARDFGFRETRDATIDAHHQRDAGPGERANPLGVQPVPFGKSERNVELDVRAEFAEDAEHDGRAGHAVHVVIAVDADAALVLDRPHNSFGGRFHAR